jgi:hypothetical protein
MLVQTNSYIVPRDRRIEHDRLMRRMTQVLARLGCPSFEVYEQMTPGWGPTRGDVRCVQVLRFRDRQHHQAVQEAERADPAAQELVREFCALVGLEAQQAQGLFLTEYLASQDGMPQLPAPDPR